MAGHNKGEMTFLQHLEELRWHIVRSFAAILIAAIVAFVFKNIVFDIIIFGPRTPDFFTNRMLCNLGKIINSQRLCINTNENQLQNIHMTGQFLENYKVSERVVNEINLMSYISIVATIVLASGILFELPVVIYFLSKIGIVTPEFLKKYRKHSIIVILALSAIITPPDVFSQILVSFPLIALYEISISISRRIYRKQEQENLAG